MAAPLCHAWATAARPLRPLTRPPAAPAGIRRPPLSRHGRVPHRATGRPGPEALLVKQLPRVTRISISTLTYAPAFRRRDESTCQFCPQKAFRFRARCGRGRPHGPPRKTAAPGLGQVSSSHKCRMSGKFWSNGVQQTGYFSACRRAQAIWVGTAASCSKQLTRPAQRC